MSDFLKGFSQIKDDIKKNAVKTTKLELLNDLGLAKDIETRLKISNNFKECVKEFEKEGNKESLLITYLRIGQSCIIDDPSSAIKSLAKALVLAIELNRFDEAGSALWLLAKAQILLHNFRKAISCYIRYLYISSKITKPIVKWRIYWRITEANLAIGNIEDALQFEKLYSECETVVPTESIVNTISSTKSDDSCLMACLPDNSLNINFERDELDDILEYIVSDASGNQKSEFETLLDICEDLNRDTKSFDSKLSIGFNRSILDTVQDIRKYLEGSKVEIGKRERENDQDSHFPVLSASYVDDFFMTCVPLDSIESDDESCVQIDSVFTKSIESTPNIENPSVINLINRNSNYKKFMTRENNDEVNKLYGKIQNIYAESHQDSAIYDRDCGRLREAIPKFEKLLNLGRELKNVQYQITALFYLQEIYRKFAYECVEKNGGCFIAEAAKLMETVLNMCKDRVALDASFKMNYEQTEIALQKYENSGRYKDALTIFTNALCKSITSSDKFRELMNRVDLGSVYLLIQKIPEAKNQFEKAFYLVSRFPETDMLTDIVYKLYEISAILKDNQSALFYSREYLKLINIHLSPNFDKVHKIYQTIMNLCMGTKNYRLGSMYAERYWLFCQQLNDIERKLYADNYYAKFFKKLVVDSEFLNKFLLKKIEIDSQNEDKSSKAKSTASDLERRWKSQNKLALALYCDKCYHFAVDKNISNVSYAKYILKNKALEAESTKNLGLCFQRIDKYYNAIIQFDILRELANDLRNRELEIIAFYYLQDTYRKLADKYRKENSGLVKSSVDDALKNSQKYCLLRLYSTPGYQKALRSGNELFRQYVEEVKNYDYIIVQKDILRQSRESQCEELEYSTLVNIGDTYDFLHKSIDAMEFYKKALSVAHSMKKRKIRLYLLKKLYEICCDLNDNESAVIYMRQYLSDCRKCCDNEGVCSALKALIELHQECNEIQRVKIYAKNLKLHINSLAVVLHSKLVTNTKNY